MNAPTNETDAILVRHRQTGRPPTVAVLEAMIGVVSMLRTSPQPDVAAAAAQEEVKLARRLSEELQAALRAA